MTKTPMELTITKTNRDETYVSVEISNGKLKVHIGVGPSGQVVVLHKNARYKTWYKGGRAFWSFEDANNAFKSVFIRSAISMAREHIFVAKPFRQPGTVNPD